MSSIQNSIRVLTQSKVPSHREDDVSAYAEQLKLAFEQALENSRTKGDSPVLARLRLTSPHNGDGTAQTWSHALAKVAQDFEKQGFVVNMHTDGFGQSKQYVWSISLMPKADLGRNIDAME